MMIQNNISNLTILDLSRLVTGTYLLKIHKNNNLIFKKISVIK
jgi:hypothetical protein